MESLNYVKAHPVVQGVPYDYLLRVDDDIYVCLHKLLDELKRNRLPRHKLLMGRNHMCFMGNSPATSYYPDESFLLMTPDVVEHITSVCDVLSSRSTWGNRDGYTRNIHACLLTTMAGFRPVNERRYVYAGETIPDDQKRFSFGEHRTEMHDGAFSTKNTTFNPWQIANVVPR